PCLDEGVAGRERDLAPRHFEIEATQSVERRNDRAPRAEQSAEAQRLREGYGPLVVPRPQAAAEILVGEIRGGIGEPRFVPGAAHLGARAPHSLGERGTSLEREAKRLLELERSARRHGGKGSRRDRIRPLGGLRGAVGKSRERESERGQRQRGACSS